MTRTLGMEEELLLVDPSTGERRNVALHVLREAEGEDDDVDVDPELLRHMIETRTDPDTELVAHERQLKSARAAALSAAERAEVAVAAVGYAPLGGDPHQVTPDSRYARIVDTFGRTGLEAGSLGMHVHVAITSEEEGVRVLDGLRPWLPVLVALSANSPYADGEDTGYASWRQQVWSRWPSAGTAEAFGSPEEYRRTCAALVDVGAALDPGMLYFDARLSEGQPTVEVRVADVCTDLDDALLVAALVRGLVETLAEQPPTTPWRSELVRAAHWRAARHGLAERLVHPLEGRLAPAAEVVAALVTAVEPALAAAGDLDRVTGALDGLRSRGGGATRQRQVVERTGDVSEVVADLVARTRASAEE